MARCCLAAEAKSLTPQPSHAAASADEARVRQARIAAVLVCMYCSLLLQATTKGRWVVEDSWSGWWCLWPGGSS